MDRQWTERSPNKHFICGSIYHLISKCQKPLEYKKKLNCVRFNERSNSASQNECKNGDDDKNQIIYASMERFSSNDESSSRNFGDSLQLNNWVLDSRTTCNMTPKDSYIIQGLLEDMDKYIEAVDEHYATENQKGQVKIRVCDDIRNILIATLHYVLLAPDLCNGVF